MRVSQLSEDKQSLIFKCPKCGEEEVHTIEELEEMKRKKEEEDVAYSASE